MIAAPRKRQGMFTVDDVSGCRMLPAAPTFMPGEVGLEANIYAQLNEPQ